MHKDELKGLREKDLLRALEELEETWSETLLHGSDEALEEHTLRTQALEEEYLRRHPDERIVPDQPADPDDDRPNRESAPGNAHIPAPPTAEPAGAGNPANEDPAENRAAEDQATQDGGNGDHPSEGHAPEGGPAGDQAAA